MATISLPADGSPNWGVPLNAAINAVNDESTATTANLSLKADAANPVFTGTVTVPDGALAVADTSGLQAALDLKAPLASPAFTGTVTGVTKAMVGLGSADDTSDANKPVSTAQQAALDLKQSTAGLDSATTALTNDALSALRGSLDAKYAPVGGGGGGTDLAAVAAFSLVLGG